MSRKYTERKERSKRHEEIIDGIEKRLIEMVGEESVRTFFNGLGAKNLQEALDIYNSSAKNENSPSRSYIEAVNNMLNISNTLKSGYLISPKSA